MKNIKKIGILSGVSLACCLMSFGLIGVNSAKAEIDPNKAWGEVKQNFTITDGASVRVDTNKGGHPGIRFQTQIPETQKANYETLKADGATFGTIVIPQEKLAENETLDLNTKDILNIPTNISVVKNNNINFRAVVSNIPEAFYMQDLTARGYITYNGETYYTNTTTRDIAYVANEAIKAGEQSNNETGLNQLLLYTRITMDGSKLTKMKDAAADLQYVKESYNGQDNLYHYTKTGNTDPTNYKLIYNLQPENLNKYMVVKVMIPNTAKTKNIKFQCWQPSNKVNTTTFDVYSLDGKIIPSYEIDTWYNCIYYLDENIFKTGELELSFANWVPDANFYIDTISFMIKEDYNKFIVEAIPELKGEGIGRLNLNGGIQFAEKTLTKSKTTYLGGYVYFETSESGGGDERKFNYKYCKYIPANDHIIFLINFTNVNSSGIDFKSVKDKKWTSFDFYDLDLKPVAKENRKINTWYYAVSPDTGYNTPAENYNNQFMFTDWAKPNTYMGGMYSITQTAYETLFKKA